MAQESDSISLQDLVYSEMIQTEAITRLLVKKGIITTEEMLAEVKAVNAEQHEKSGKVGMS